MADDRLSNQLASLQIARDAPRSGRGLRWLPVALAVLLAGVAYSQRGALRDRFNPREVAVTSLTTVGASQESALFTATGYVVARRKATLSPKIPGRLAKLHFREGQRVKAGDLVAELETDVADADVARAQAAAAAARARAAATAVDRKEAERVADRERSLSERGVTQGEAFAVASARSAALRAGERALQADVRAADTATRAARVSRGALEVRAPFDGVVTQKLADIGDVVGIGGATTSAGSFGGIVVLSDFGTLEIETEVTEARLGAIKLGLPAEVTLDAFADQRFRGEVAGLRPSLDRAKATLPVWVRVIDAPPNLYPDMAAKVRFLSTAIDDKKLKEPPKQVLPGSALVDRDGQKSVFLLRDGAAVLVPVTLGAPLGSGFELVAGVAPGDVIIDSPPADLASGVRVKKKGSDS